MALVSVMSPSDDRQEAQPNLGVQGEHGFQEAHELKSFDSSVGLRDLHNKPENESDEQERASTRHQCSISEEQQSLLRRSQDDIVDARRPSILTADLKYASLDALTPWFPQANPAHDRSRTFSAFRSRRNVVLLCASVISSLVFLVNLIGTIVLHQRSPQSRLYEGSCITAGRLDAVIHVVINALSTILLAQSNLCMQLLAAPTRKEVDKAHKKRVWLDIGIPTLRNIRHIERHRQVVWIILALASLPIHIFFNSAVVPIDPQNGYRWAVVAPDFLQGHEFDIAGTESTMGQRATVHVWGWDSTHHNVSRALDKPGDAVPGDAITAMQAEYLSSPSIYRKLDNLNCLRRYAQFELDASDVLLISSFDTLNSMNVSEIDNPLLVASVWDNPWTWPLANGKFWQCGTSNFFNCNEPREWLNTASKVADWNVYGYKVDYCLSKSNSVQDKCVIRLEVPIMIIVCAANLIKCIGIFYTTWLYGRRGSPKPLSNLGDAAQSFLKHPDQETRYMSLADRSNVEKLWKLGETKSERGRLWHAQSGRKEYWFRVSSLRSWVTTIVTCSSFLCVVVGLLGFGAVQTAARTGTTRLKLMNFGFGKPNPYEKSIGGSLGVFHDHPTKALYVSIAWANFWQLFVSLLYLRYNYQQSSFAVGQEWSRFACVDTRVKLESSLESRLAPETTGTWTGFKQLFAAKTPVRKTLRVSEPSGLQRSTYFVSMPLKYGIPLIAVMTTLHWLISRSIFVVAALTYYGDEPLAAPTYTSAYSLLPMTIATAIGFALVGILIWMGLRKFPGTIPLASSCSAAISAACHPPEEDKTPWLFPLQWGVVSYDDDGIGHCALSTFANIEAPRNDGKTKYA